MYSTHKPLLQTTLLMQSTTFTSAVRGENSINISSPTRVCLSAQYQITAEWTLVPEHALQLAWQGSQVLCAASW